MKKGLIDWTNALICIWHEICKTKLSFIDLKQMWRYAYIVTAHKDFVRLVSRISAHAFSPFSPWSVDLAFWFFQPQFCFLHLQPCTVFSFVGGFWGCFTMIMSRSYGKLDSNSSHVFILILYFFAIFCFSAYAACFFPNGSDRNAEYGSELYQPCNRSAEHSMCCRAKDHTCRSDGLCFDAWSSLVWRESCTDPTWNSSACVKLCTSGIGTPR